MAKKTRVLGCGSCGAPVNLKNKKCNYCGSAITAVLCGNCGSDTAPDLKNCVRCGYSLIPAEELATGGDCPRCKETLITKQLHQLIADNCESCRGVFINNDNLQSFIRKQVADGSANSATKLARFELKPDPSGYIRCPQCSEIMNRTNFSVRGGKKSGVLVDICRDHGIWFDEGELEKVAEFVRSGGMFS